MPMHCVYLISGPKDRHRYIGKTCHFDKRWNEHKRLGRNGGGGKLYRAMHKHGVDAFQIEVVQDGLTSEEAASLEVRLIDEMNTQEDGLNITVGGDYSPMLGRTHTEEARRKIGAAGVGRKNKFKGKTLPLEWRENLSKGGKGKVPNLSPELRGAMSERMRGNTLGIGYRHTPAAKAKIAESSSGRRHSDEAKQKISAANLGVKHSKKRVEKMAETKSTMSDGFVLACRALTAMGAWTRRGIAEGNGLNRQTVSDMVAGRTYNRLIISEEQINAFSASA